MKLGYEKGAVATKALKAHISHDNASATIPSAVGLPPENTQPAGPDGTGDGNLELDPPRTLPVKTVANWGHRGCTFRWGITNHPGITSLAVKGLEPSA